MNEQKSKHWETIYETKTPEQVSWTQVIPQTSLDFIASFGMDKTAKIIDIGGGDSNLVDHLIDMGFSNITVLDISIAALNRAKKRLGKKADSVSWIHSDILDFEPEEKYDVWHDRAAFHFLTEESQIEKYTKIASNAAIKNMVIGTFSDNGPLKCSGLEIKQYNNKTLPKVFENYFTLLDVKIEDHLTPFETKQNFIFCSFTKSHSSI